VRNNYHAKRITLLLAAICLTLGSGGKSATGQSDPLPAVTAALQKQMSSAHAASGIQVVRVSYAVGGMKLDLRYRVTDLKKARQIFTNETPLALIDQATGTVLGVPNMPKVGKLRQIPNQDETWRVYWIMFDNPGALVRRGGKVTLSIGDVRIKDINVE
jgi:hypothetical protein